MSLPFYENVLPWIIRPDLLKIVINVFNILRLLNILYNPNPHNRYFWGTSITQCWESVWPRGERLSSLKIWIWFTSWIRVLYSFPLAARHTNNNRFFFDYIEGLDKAALALPSYFGNWTTSNSARWWYIN